MIVVERERTHVVVLTVTMAEYWGRGVDDGSEMLGGRYQVSSEEYGSGDEYSSEDEVVVGVS